MPNTNKIKARIVEKGLTIGKIANEMGISAYILGQKILGKSPMTLGEARCLQEKLDIPDDELAVYFFTLEVA